MRPSLHLSGLAIGSTLVFASEARAGVAWGDASLKSDDVRIEIDESGRADVLHTVGLHIGAKKFRAFVIDGIDPVIEPPSDEATTKGRDGPGWPIAATDGKGQSVDAFVEPGGGAGKLRVRFGPEGVGRGDYTLRIRYRVDLAKRGTITRDGAMAKLAWSTPRWPEGYDAAHFVFSLPSAKAEPRISIADPEGDGEHPLEGVAVVAMHRTQLRDEVEITRPHVPQGESTRFVLRVDPRAFSGVPSVAASVATRDLEGAPTESARGRGALAGVAAFAAFALGLVLRKRDLDAKAFRPLIPVSGTVRATSYAVLVGGAVAATFGGHPLAGATMVMSAMAMATQRAPRPEAPPRTAGRWLAIPEQAIPAKKPLGRAPFEGILMPTIAVIVIGAAALALSRRDVRAALGLLIVATALVPLFATGRRAQLPPDSVADGWTLLAAISAALRRLGRTPKVIARTGSVIDEVRLRIEGAEGVRAVEIGCALVHASGGTALVPEILVRCVEGSAAALAAARRADQERDCALLLGRDGERVLAIRPVDVSPASIARLVDSALALPEGAPARPTPPPPVRARAETGSAAAVARGSL